MENEKEAIELTDAALTAATGGTDEINVEVGVRLEPGDWMEVGNAVLMYNGPAKFVPASELIPVDLYIRHTYPGTGILMFYSYAGTAPREASVFCGVPEVHSAPFPYPIRSLWDGEFAEMILADLIKEGYSGEELLSRFKAKQSQIRPAVEDMLEEAERVASGTGEYSTFEDIFGNTIVTFLPRLRITRQNKKIGG